MAIFIRGTTNCALCGLVVERADEAVNFPPLFLNQHHDVFEINDAVVHRSCLDERPYAQLALAKLDSYEARRGRPKTCTICGRVISDPDDYFGTGPLADDPVEPIARLDWFEAHVSCLRGWEGRPALLHELRELARTDDWEGDVIDVLAMRLDELGVDEQGPPLG